jgi:predicted  nucleic acid-binding Zn-ribbon protein
MIKDNITINKLIRCKNIRTDDIDISYYKKINFICDVCSYRWEGRYNNYIRSDNCIRGCPRCSGKVGKLTNEIIDDDLVKSKRDIQRIGECVDSYTPIQWKCLKDGHIWEQKPNAIRNGWGCPKCGNSISKTNEQIDLMLVSENRNIVRVGDFTGGNKNPIEWECIKCCGVWNACVNNVVDGKSGCPYCGRNKNEKMFFDLLKEKFGDNEVERGYKIEDGEMWHRCDFYIKSINTIIEYNGIQHYEPVKHFGGIEKFYRQKRIDEFVRSYCLRNNIKLLEVDGRKITIKRKNMRGYINGI